MLKNISFSRISSISTRDGDGTRVVGTVACVVGATEFQRAVDIF